jgi:hypothetical protein
VLHLLRLPCVCDVNDDLQHDGRRRQAARRHANAQRATPAATTINSINSSIDSISPSAIGACVSLRSLMQRPVRIACDEMADHQSLSCTHVVPHQAAAAVDRYCVSGTWCCPRNVIVNHDGFENAQHEQLSANMQTKQSCSPMLLSITAV